MQGAVDADAFFHGEQRGEVGHAVGGGSDGDPPVGGGLAGAVGGAVGVEAVGPAAGLLRGVLVAPPGQLGGEGGVDPGAVLGAEVGGFPGDEGGPPFAAVAVFHRLQDLGHFVDEGVGEADVAVAFVRAVPAGQGDLGADGAAGVGGAHAVLDEAGAVAGGEGVGEPGLPGADRGGELVQGGDLVDQVGVGAGGVECGQHRPEREGVPGARHVFDSTA